MRNNKLLNINNITLNESFNALDAYKLQSIKVKELKIGQIVYGESLPFKILELVYIFHEFELDTYDYLVIGEFIDEKSWLNGKKTFFSLSDANVVGGGYNPWLWFTYKSLSEEYSQLSNKVFNETKNCKHTVKYFNLKPKKVSHELMNKLGFKEVDNDYLFKINEKD